MKHKNLLKLMAVVMILAMAMTMLIACGPKEPEPEVDPKPTFTAKQAADEISEAIVNSLGDKVDVTKQVGFEYALNIPTDEGEVVINLKGILDTTAANSKVYLDFVQNFDKENRVFSISADDKYLYFDSMDAKKKFTGFNLAKNLVGASLPSYDSISGGMIGSLPGIVFDLIMDLGEDAKFEHEVDPDEGTTVNTINGSFEGLAPLIGGVVDGIIPGAGAKLGEFLGKVNIELTTIISADKKIDYADLIFTVDGKELDLGFTSKLENTSEAWKPEFKVPEKYDTRYVETKLLNFVMDGEFNIANAKYAYDIKVDIDPFEMLDKAVVVKKDGSLAFDVTRLLDITDGGFYVTVKHECAADCNCNKIAKADGSIFSIAYAPGDFGNNNIYMNVNLQALLPKDIFEKALGGAENVTAIETELSTLLGGKTLIDMIPAGQQTLTMDTKALLASASSPIADADLKAEVATADALENYNPLKTVVDVYNFLAGITYDYENGVRFEVAPIVDALNNANTIINESLAKSDDVTVKLVMAALNKKGIAIDTGAAVQAIFPAEAFEVKVINAAYGDPALNDVNFKDLYDNDATVKPARITSVAPALVDGKLQMTTKSGVDLSGNLSDKEWTAVLNAANKVKVNYKLSDGTEVTNYDANIITISGLDLSKKDVDQTVYVVVAPVNGLGKDSGHIAAHQFTTTVKVSSLAEKDGAVFTDAINDTAYAYESAIDSNVSLKLTYKDATTKTYNNIKPSTNKQMVKNNKVYAVADFKLGYNKFGYTYDVEVKAASKQADTVAEVTVEAGKAFDLTKDFKFKVGETDYTLAGVESINAKTVSFSWTTEPARYILKANYSKLGAFTNYTVVFDEVGEYELVMNVAGGFAKTFKFTVTVPGAPAQA